MGSIQKIGEAPDNPDNSAIECWFKRVSYPIIENW